MFLLRNMKSDEQDISKVIIKDMTQIKHTSSRTFWRQKGYTRVRDTNGIQCCNLPKDCQTDGRKSLVGQKLQSLFQSVVNVNLSTRANDNNATSAR